MRAVLAALAAALLIAGPGAAGAGADVSLLQVGTFTAPINVAAPPGDTSRLFVVERTGRIQVVRDGVTSTFADLRDHVDADGSEQGMFAMAFAADYATSGHLYLSYTAPVAGTDGGDLVISELTRTDADHADPSSERRILTIPHRLYDNHNGGQIQVGPDGMLWIGTGDGGYGNDILGNAQRLDPATNDAATGADARLGKLLRIDPTPGAGCGGQCTIPAGNPGFPQPEVFAYGLRNPWRFSFDRATGDLLVGDVGQDTWEEVDLLAAPGRGAGANLGWPAYEGLHLRGQTGPVAAPGITMPVLEKQHGTAEAWRSLVGGVVVRDPALPSLAGRYLYADTYQGHLHAVTLGPGGATADGLVGSLRVPIIASFGEDACGRVYAVSLEGPVYRLAESGACVTPAVPAAPGAPVVNAPAAARPPGLTLRAATRQRSLRTGIVTVRVACDEVCTVRAAGTFLVRKGARAAAALRTRPVTARLAERATVSVRLKVGATVRRTLRRALARGRRVTVRVDVQARDVAGRLTRRSVRSAITLR